MLYREMGTTGDKVSILGYGCMRFPTKDRRIDEESTEKQIISAIENGVNYFDTAYIYPNSETVLGKILSKGYRDKVMIATKLPPFMVHSRKDMDTILNTQLKRLQTDHVDYYLMHNLNGIEGWLRIKNLGVEEFLMKSKEDGKINRIGFSYHGDPKQFKEIIDDYPWDFCQIQYNYMDENIQAGKEGLLYAASKGLGVSVMEPLRGGLLANKMPSQAQKLFEQAGMKRSPAEWALRWIWNHPEASVVLSGMNDEQQIEENIKVASNAYPNSLSDNELNIIDEAKRILKNKVKVECTSCGYCMPCPVGVNIPMCFAYYNDKYIYEKKSIHYLGMLGGMDGGKPSHASLCKDCGKCEKHCPQNLPIRFHLELVAKDMENIFYRPIVRLAQTYYKIRRMLKRKK